LVPKLIGGKRGEDEPLRKTSRRRPSFKNVNLFELSSSNLEKKPRRPRRGGGAVGNRPSETESVLLLKIGPSWKACTEKDGWRKWQRKEGGKRPVQKKRTNWCIQCKTVRNVCAQKQKMVSTAANRKRIEEGSIPTDSRWDWAPALQKGKCSSSSGTGGKRVQVRPGSERKKTQPKRQKSLAGGTRSMPPQEGGEERRLG